MFISALLIRRSRPALVFYLPQAQRDSCGAYCSSNFVTVPPMYVQVCSVVSQVYLNDNRAKQKRDFPSRGQWRSPACKSGGSYSVRHRRCEGGRVAPVMDWSESSNYAI